jgi:hypothetical protein
MDILTLEEAHGFPELLHLRGSRLLHEELRPEKVKIQPNAECYLSQTNRQKNLLLPTLALAHLVDCFAMRLSSVSFLFASLGSALSAELSYQVSSFRVNDRGRCFWMLTLTFFVVISVTGMRSLLHSLLYSPAGSHFQREWSTRSNSHR